MVIRRLIQSDQNSQHRRGGREDREEMKRRTRDGWVIRGDHRLDEGAAVLRKETHPLLQDLFSRAVVIPFSRGMRLLGKGVEEVISRLSGGISVASLYCLTDPNNLAALITLIPSSRKQNTGGGGSGGCMKHKHKDKRPQQRGWRGVQHGVPVASCCACRAIMSKTSYLQIKREYMQTPLTSVRIQPGKLICECSGRQQESALGDRAKRRVSRR